MDNKPNSPVAGGGASGGGAQQQPLPQPPQQPAQQPQSQSAPKPAQPPKPPVQSSATAQKPAVKPVEPQKKPAAPAAPKAPAAQKPGQAKMPQPGKPQPPAPQAAPSVNASAQPVNKPKKRRGLTVVIIILVVVFILLLGAGLWFFRKDLGLDSLLGSGSSTNGTTAAIDTVQTKIDDTKKELSEEDQKLQDRMSELEGNVANLELKDSSFATKEEVDGIITFLKSFDRDSDGLSDYDEVIIHETNPDSADTDGDGFDDKAEIDGGFNPNGEGKLDVQVRSDDSTDSTDANDSDTNSTNSSDSGSTDSAASADVAGEYSGSITMTDVALTSNNVAAEVTFVQDSPAMTANFTYEIDGVSYRSEMSGGLNVLSDTEFEGTLQSTAISGGATNEYETNVSLVYDAENGLLSGVVEFVNGDAPFLQGNQGEIIMETNSIDSSEGGIFSTPSVGGNQ